ncbi:conserved hypothetical protein (plasmid) [Rhodococcus jostii RHA1]|uniref:Uncharacterized protein n=1 Tax=Rhodococcus jostii (strain RHA1) TaxID=101510 RepID=Q0RYB4_RHOJR|nr:conserved hypothetical protein [Rhodococcus jostii RHA1]
MPPTPARLPVALRRGCSTPAAHDHWRRPFRRGDTRHRPRSSTAADLPPRSSLRLRRGMRRAADTGSTPAARRGRPGTNPHRCPTTAGQSSTAGPSGLIGERSCGITTGSDVGGRTSGSPGTQDCIRPEPIGGYMIAVVIERGARDDLILRRFTPNDSIAKRGAALGEDRAFVARIDRTLPRCQLLPRQFPGSGLARARANTRLRCGQRDHSACLQLAADTPQLRAVLALGGVDEAAPEATPLRGWSVCARRTQQRRDRKANRSRRRVRGSIAPR